MMISRQRTLSRRTVLRGAGVALGLPWLEAMAPPAFGAQAAAAKSPVRMAVLYMANGVNTSQWTSQGQGRDFTLAPTLQPLTEFKDQLLVLTNLWNAAANTGDGHYTKESSLLTCTTITKTLGVDINIHGPSMDQVAAQAGLRLPHCVERSDNSAGARDGPAVGLCAPLPRGIAAGERGQAGHATAGPGAGAVEDHAGESRGERPGAGG